MRTTSARVDAGTLREVVSRYATALELHRDELNSLNVYPVPDGDTGTNLALTQRAVAEEVERTGGASLAELGEAISRAALMGARGNSGVILAQAWRGMCGRVCAGDGASPGVVVEALQAAASEARRAVARPVEGTALSVLSEAAAAARGRLSSGGGMADVAAAALEGARRCLARTPEVLPELGAAGVVDAGGKGIVLLMDSLASVVSGTRPTEEVGPLGPVGGDGQPPGPEQGTGTRYEVMYLLEVPDEAVPPLRGRLDRLGDSLVVVGGGGVFKVHVHTDEPDRVVEAALGAGRPREVSIIDLREQVSERCVAGQAREARAGERTASALVVVTQGEGLARTFGSLGALVVEGGPKRGAPPAEISGALERSLSSSDEVLVVAVDGRSLAVARSVARRSGERITVVPVGEILQGLAAAAAFLPTLSAEDNLTAMNQAARGCAVGKLNPASGQSFAEAAVVLVRALQAPEHELITVIHGSNAGADDAVSVERALREVFPDLEVEVHRGDQPGPPFLIGLE